MTIIFPSTKSIKDAIRQEIGRTVTFVMDGSYSACPVCSGASLYDSVNSLSLNQFCTVCSGNYWISQDSLSDVVAHIRWRVGDESEFGVAGKTFTGDCTVTIGIDDLSNDQLGKIKKIVVDDRNLEVFRTVKRGVPDVDRIRFMCREVGKE